MLQGFYIGKLKMFFGINNLVSRFKNPGLYFKNMLYLRTINPLYSNIKLNNNVSFIFDKKTFKLLKIKIIKLNKIRKKINNYFQLKDIPNIPKMFFGKTDEVLMPVTISPLATYLFAASLAFLIFFWLYPVPVYVFAETLIQ